MRKHRPFALALAVSILAPLPLIAQVSGPPQGGGRGMMGARLLVEQGSVEYLVTKAADLHLTAEQTSRLTAIGAAWSDSTKAAREQVAAAMPAPGQAMGGDREAMMQRMQAIRPVLEQLRETDVKAVDEAFTVLDEHQRTAARKLLDERAQNAAPRRGGGGQR